MVLQSKAEEIPTLSQLAPVGVTWTVLTLWLTSWKENGSVTRSLAPSQPRLLLTHQNMAQAATCKVYFFQVIIRLSILVTRNQQK